MSEERNSIGTVGTSSTEVEEDLPIVDEVIENVSNDVTEEVDDVTEVTEVEDDTGSGSEDLPAGEGSVPDVQKEPKAKKTIEDRQAALKKQTWEARQAQRDASNAKRAADDAIRALEEAQQAAASVPEPDIEQYEDHQQYAKDYQTYAQQQAQSTALKTQKEMQQRQQQDYEYSDMMSKWEYNKSKAIEKNPNFNKQELQVANTLRAYQNPAMEILLVKSPLGTKLVEHFAKNPESLESIAQIQDPMQVAVEVGKLSARFEASPKKITKSPRPISPGGTGSGASKSSIDKMSQTEYEAFRNKQQYGF